MMSMERPLHRSLTQHPIAVHALAQAHDPAEAIDHAKAVRAGGAHQKPAVIRAKVDRGEHAMGGAPDVIAGTWGGSAGHRVNL